MPEILTESFCERCGTRYTFESTAPRKTRRLGQFKTLSKGLKNYVLSDDTSMDEAMASARSDEERETTAQQLDAFHATFNFCMNCRQYTCGNCWNQSEGRCLTCSPNLGHDILHAPFAGSTPFEPLPISAEAWPTADLPPLESIIPAYGGDGSNGRPAADMTVEPSNGVVHAPEPVEDDDPGAHFSFLTAGRTAAEIPVEANVETTELAAEIEAGPIEESPEVAQAAEAAEPVVADAIVAQAAEVDEVDEPPWVEAAATEPIVEATPASPLPDDPAVRASELASHTAELLSRFRPGQNIDAELAAFEAGVEMAEPVADVEAEPVAAIFEPEPQPTIAAAWPEPDPQIVAAAWPEPEPEAIVLTAEPTWVAAEPEPVSEPEPEPVPLEPEPAPFAAEPEPEPVAIVAEPEPIAAEPEPVAAAEPTPQPVAAAEPQPEAPPIAAAAEPVRKDRIEQPTWRIFAPDQTSPAVGQPIEAPVAPAPPPSAPVAPLASGAEPQWPARPDVPESPSMALLANRTRSSSDALWAASTQQVLSPAAAGPAAPSTSVQPCSSCGLSLSATARFCRRCGTRQG